MNRMPKTLHFIRHGEGKANAKGIMMGSSKTADQGLSAAGKTMARHKAEEYKALGFLPRTVFCSQMPRTQETARIIREVLGLEQPLIVLPELNERSFGKYEGRPYQEAIDAFAREGDSPETMEAVPDFIDRVLRGFEYIKQQAEDTALIVTHSNPLAVLRAFLYYPDDLPHYWEHETDSYVSGFEVQV